MNQIVPSATLAKKPLPPALLAGLQALFGGRLSVSEAIRAHHGRDESSYDPMLPDAVVFAHSTEEVAAAVALCNTHAVPVIAFGTGTSLEGHVLALHGGVTIDLSQMNRVLAIHAEDLTATVQAGVTRKQLNQEIKDSGLFFPIDPGADASLGGMAATRASGTNAVRYGTMRENTLALTVVAADGRILKTGTRAKKSSAGYDLTRLFVGSEGTLGIITEVTVRLYPQPEAISAAVCSFPTAADAVNAVIQTIQLGVPVARVEFLDENGRCRRAGANGAADCRRAQCQRLRMGHPARGPLAAMDRAPQRLFRAAATAARRARDFDRLLRADLAAGRMHPRDQGRLRARRYPAFDHRPCRRRQFSRAAAGRPG
jgi:D-lactate dehydrogenase (cytochrome)